MNIRNILIVGATTLAIFISVVTIGYSALFAEIDLAANSAAPQAPVKIEIVAGSSLSRVAAELAEAGFLRSPTIFKLMARVQGVENSIRTGEYELQPGITPVQLLAKIVNGESVQYRITLVEGWTFEQALQAIWSADNLVPSLVGLSIAEVSAGMNLGRENPEGLLYPDTYFYTKGTSDIELLLRASKKLNTVLSAAWAARLGELPYADQYEALTMASIIEKESASNSERGLIGAVFVSRMELGMRLQSDPTVIYGMGDRYAGNIRREDLSEQTPYNTYRIDGLPPTPIALSGEESIVAALNPEQTDYLYFVAKGDGSHHFSRSLDEHNAAVREYQLQIAN
ncbi:MAG: endolytic transglycosylase MltG [Gammaproteobacteria bacterium]|nr:endolytic transglycosylase MltG [Gammaproteobacteria bacterium]MDG2337439.1 endolytic transglycosylase MltG [Gammaproteobacteria bacterium]